MKAFLLGSCVLVAAGGAALDAQQKRAPRTATFAILVTDADGAQVPSVLVTVEGPAARTVRTEGGRIARTSPGRPATCTGMRLGRKDEPASFV